MRWWSSLHELFFIPSGLNSRSSTNAGNFCFETRSTIIAARLYPLFEYEYSEPGVKSSAR